MQAPPDIAALPTGDLAKARALVLRYGWLATSYQILNPGLKLWFPKPGATVGNASGPCTGTGSGTGKPREPAAVTGYADWGRVRVAAGAPICAPVDMAAAAEAFEADARAEGMGVCYFAAGTRLEGLLGAAQGYAKVLLGAQPVWDPAAWPGILAARPSLRAQLARARNKGVTVTEWGRARASSSPELRRCLKEWLSRRRMPAMHFLVEPWTLDRLWDRRIFVAEQSGRAVAFLMVSPVPVRNGWLVEQIVRADAAPNGAAELLLDTAFRAAAADGLEYFTLGLSPLSGTALREREDGPWWLALVFRWLRLHGGRFYNFRGLEAFKAKFSPAAWEPIYAICDRPAFTPGVLLAIAAVFGGVSPFLFTAMALGKAMKLELYWLLGKPAKTRRPFQKV